MTHIGTPACSIQCLNAIMVLPLLEDHYIFQGEEDLMKIKAKDILVNELSESMGPCLGMLPIQ